MKRHESRQILLVHAIEQADSEDAIFSSETRDAAASLAGSPLPRPSTRDQQDRFFQQRAASLLGKLVGKFPETALWAEPGGQWKWGVLTSGLLIVAAVIGYLTNELGPERRINILAFPLLGIMAWSGLVVVRDIWLLTRSRDRLFSDSSIQWLVRILCQQSSPLKDRQAPESGALEGARALFEKTWLRLQSPAIGCRIKSLLHVTAMVLAIAAIGGMYVRGLAQEYRAVWESTFFESGPQLRPFVQTILGPATSLIGDTIPSGEELDAMRWQSSDPANPVGERADRWIHWYAITIGLFVVLPRFILALTWRARSAWLGRTIPFRQVAPEYFERLVALSSGEGLVALFVPYATRFEKPEDREAAERCLAEYKERRIEARWAESIAFGDEETMPQADSAGHDLVVPILVFAATPEVETHRLVLDGLVEKYGDKLPLILLDQRSFDRKNASFPDAESRYDSRRTSWEKLTGHLDRDLLYLSERQKV
ncbi:MAG: DUF2868 domain-containing protein [Verrucomicrobiota bacterium]